MFPDLWTQQTATGPLSFHTYGLFLMLGFGAAAWVLSRRMRQIGVNPDKLLPIIAIAIVFGIAGARLLHFIGAEPELFLSQPWVFFDLTQGGMAFYGGAIAATVMGVLYVWNAGLPVLKMADIAAPCILLGLAIGRLGCFSAGCCHGGVCELPGQEAQAVEVITSLTGGLFPGGEIVLVDGFPWIALVFKQGVGVGAIHDVPVYPTQLWESSAAFLLFGLLSWIWWRHRRFDGQVLALMLLTYPPLRTTIETFRGDTIRGTEYFGLLSTSQVVSIPVFALGLVIIAWRFNKGVAPEQPYELNEEELFDDLVE
ncbi:MAG: prolipoprotein diacylglyceryl transferase [Alphaproteobacteria bacterium]|nr:prolipoprotein diacylglyceryl transferase [Alphaproteobacteria bacterium]MCB9792904.1 prolipoprotein diacylglyceryl transferase [Alphaproteobacteria bacterium]